MGKRLKFSGKKFGKWTAVRAVKSDSRGVHWLCRCECGNEKIATANTLKWGKHTHCDDCHPPGTKHGLRYEPEYSVWGNMKQRCNNPNDKNYYKYGGRGITVCKRWEESFEAFYEDMGPRPSENHTVERLDNSGPYCKENCKWATMREQSNNTRQNKYITFKGETKTIAQWARSIGISDNALRNRIRRGWSIERVMTQPTRNYAGSRDITFRGETKSIKEWAKELGINVGTLYSRLNYGWSVERALTEPVRKKHITSIKPQINDASVGKGC